MKTYDKMPDEIILPTGEILKPVIGGYLDQKRFCDVYNTFASVERDRIIAEAKRRKLKYRTIGVLSRRLRGRYDLHQRLYQPNAWMYVQISLLSDRERTSPDDEQACSYCGDVHPEYGRGTCPRYIAQQGGIEV